MRKVRLKKIRRIISQLDLRYPLFYNAIQHFFSLGNSITKDIDENLNINIKNHLDIGCGTGIFTKNIKCEKYIGIDINPIYINYATKKFGNESRSYQVLNANNISFPDNYFDTVSMISFIHHIPDDQLSKLYEKVRRITKKQILIIDGLPPKKRQFFMRLVESIDEGNYRKDFESKINLLKHYFDIKKAEVSKKGLCTAAIIVCTPKK